MAKKGSLLKNPRPPGFSHSIRYHSPVMSISGLLLSLGFQPLELQVLGALHEFASEQNEQHQRNNLQNTADDLA